MIFFFFFNFTKPLLQPHFQDDKERKERRLCQKVPQPHTVYLLLKLHLCAPKDKAIKKFIIIWNTAEATASTSDVRDISEQGSSPPVCSPACVWSCSTVHYSRSSKAVGTDLVKLGRTEHPHPIETCGAAARPPPKPMWGAESLRRVFPLGNNKMQIIHLKNSPYFSSI